MNTIYTITVLRVQNLAIPWQRTWGWEVSYEKAEHLVTHGDDMFWAGSGPHGEAARYTHALIEEFRPGYYHGSLTHQWFEALDFQNGVPQLVRAIAAPAGLEQVVCFAMG